ncbi:MAG: DUF5694 domain-containing protein [Chitinophagaceae bacterium]
MKLLLSTLCLICWLNLALSQQYDYISKQTRQKIDSLMWSGERKPAKALLLGTWHFGYPDQDAHKTKAEDRVDVLSAQRQKEIAEVIAVLKRYNPTRIYVESGRQPFIDSLYNAYLSGAHKLRRNELDQIAMRLGKELGLKKLYAADDGNFMNEFYRQMPFIDSLQRVSAARNESKDEYWNRQYMQMYDYADGMLKQQTILEHLLVYADPYVLKRNHGHYIVSGFQTNNDAGPDRLATWWYSRNLRIFRNIVDTDLSADDRILVIFGNGHMSILRHLFESSPEFKLVELKEVAEGKGVGN